MQTKDSCRRNVDVDYEFLNGQKTKQKKTCQVPYRNFLYIVRNSSHLVVTRAQYIVRNSCHLVVTRAVACSSSKNWRPPTHANAVGKKVQVSANVFNICTTTIVPILIGGTLWSSCRNSYDIDNNWISVIATCSEYRTHELLHVLVLHAVLLLHVGAWMDTVLWTRGAVLSTYSTVRPDLHIFRNSYLWQLNLDWFRELVRSYGLWTSIGYHECRRGATPNQMAFGYFSQWRQLFLILYLWNMKEL